MELKRCRHHCNLRLPSNTPLHLGRPLAAHHFDMRPTKAGPPTQRCDILKSQSNGAEALPSPMQLAAAQQYTITRIGRPSAAKHFNLRPTHHFNLTPTKAGPPTQRCETLNSKSNGAAALPLPMQPAAAQQYTITLGAVFGRPPYQIEARQGGAHRLRDVTS